MSRDARTVSETMSFFMSVAYFLEHSFSIHLSFFGSQDPKDPTTNGSMVTLSNCCHVRISSASNLYFSIFFFLASRSASLWPSNGQVTSTISASLFCIRMRSGLTPSLPIGWFSLNTAHFLAAAFLFYSLFGCGEQ